MRDYGLSALKELGYDTLEARTAVEALEIFKRTPAIALVFTDVVLSGGTSGRDLADRIQELRPTVPTRRMRSFTTALSTPMCSC